jgi:hypothetical protein
MPLEVCVLGEVFGGENARCISVVRSSLPSPGCRVETERQFMAGAGI